MSALTIPVLKEAYLSKIRDRVKNHASLDDYKASATFNLDEEGLFKETRIQCLGEDPKLTHSSNASEDIENAILIHKWMPKLTRLQSSDGRLWAYLTHARFFSYTAARFPHPSQPEKIVQNILSHWFVGRGGLRRNAISRLWLAADLTCAPWERNESLGVFERSDRYFYTRILLQNQNTYQQLVERNFGHCPVTLVSTLDVIDELSGQITGMTDFVAELGKALNLISSHSDMGAVSPSDLRQYIFEISKSLHS